jgi:LacI family transcriptional regulator
MPIATAITNRRVTITDVAKRAGVHYTTVSMALRNHPRLPVATRARLRALAEEMGYRPDPVLQALMDYRGQRKPHRPVATLAYVTNGDTRWGWKQTWTHSESFAGAARRAFDLGYQLEHFWLGEPGLTHHRLSDVLHSRGIAGVIIASHSHELDTPLQFDWSKFSAVKIGFFPQEPMLHNVSYDQFSAIRLAMRRVKAAGYSRIGFALPPLWDLNSDLAWSSGFLAEQRTVPLTDQLPSFIFPDELPNGANIPFDQLASRGAFETWLGRFRPDALISTEAFVKPHLDAMGISIPRDLGFADILVQRSDGKLAGVRQNCQRVGEVAVEILARHLQQHAFGVPEFPTTTLVESTWLDGESLPQAQAVESLSHIHAVAGGK